MEKEAVRSKGPDLPLLLLLTVLSIVFATALTFVTVELPRALDGLLDGLFPDYTPGMEEADETMAIARPVGYTCLALVIALIAAGFISSRTRLSSVGVLLLVLPTFGHFAAAMFLLAGVGVLRVLWLPFWEAGLMKLGDVAYLPYMGLVYPSSLMGVDIRTQLGLFLAGLGFFIFVMGTVAWMYGRLSSRYTVTFWIYQYSRHPQYLGFIVWSYGIMLLAAQERVPFAGENPGASLPWVVSSLIVVSIAMAEEIQMNRRDRGTYLSYRSSAPFMVPVPRFAASVVAAPTRVLFKKDYPENGWEILGTVVIYGVVLILLSLPFVLLEWPPGLGWSVWPEA